MTYVWVVKTNEVPQVFAEDEVLEQSVALTFSALVPPVLTVDELRHKVWMHNAGNIEAWLVPVNTRADHL